MFARAAAAAMQLYVYMLVPSLRGRKTTTLHTFALPRILCTFEYQHTYLPGDLRTGDEERMWMDGYIYISVWLCRPKTCRESRGCISARGGGGAHSVGRVCVHTFAVLFR